MQKFVKWVGYVAAAMWIMLFVCMLTTSLGLFSSARGGIYNRNYIRDIFGNFRYIPDWFSVWITSLAIVAGITGVLWAVMIPFVYREKGASHYFRARDR